MAPQIFICRVKWAAFVLRKHRRAASVPKNETLIVVSSEKLLRELSICPSFSLSVFLTENGFVSHYTTRYHHWRLHPWLDRAYHARKLARRFTYDFFGGTPHGCSSKTKNPCVHTIHSLPSPALSFPTFSLLTNSSHPPPLPSLPLHPFKFSNP